MHLKQSKNKHKPNPNHFGTSFTFEAIGSHWQIDSEKLSSSKQKVLMHEIQSLAENFDKTYSRFREDSLVTAMAKKEGIYRLPATAKPMLDLYYQLSVLTEEQFTPLIGQVLVEAGYDASYSLQPKKMHQPPPWNEALTYTYPELTIKQPVLLDFGAMGKGYLIDLVSNLLRTHAIKTFCVEAGGDMYYQTAYEEPLRVGLEHPDDASLVIGVAEVVNQSICASAGNRRKWDKYHHIINPKTLSSPKKIKATWVIADTALLADALATALFFYSPQAFSKYFANAWAIMYEDSSLETSSTFPATFFTKE